MREEVHFRDVDCILKNHNLLINHGDSLVLKWQPKRFLLNQLWHLVKRVVGSDHAVDPRYLSAVWNGVSPGSVTWMGGYRLEGSSLCVCVCYRTTTKCNNNLLFNFRCVGATNLTTFLPSNGAFATKRIILNKEVDWFTTDS